MQANYVHLTPGATPPKLDSAPFKAVVVVECDVTPDWQMQTSDWLVRSGCRYMMAWGQKCSEWDDSVDLANLAMFDFGDIPEDDFVMTTWHEREPLADTFWFAGKCATHPSLVLERTYIVHVAPESQETALLEAYHAAQKQIS